MLLSLWLCGVLSSAARCRRAIAVCGKTENFEVFIFSIACVFNLFAVRAAAIAVFVDGLQYLYADLIISMI